ADLSKVAPEVLSKEQRTAAAGMIDRDIQRRTDEVNARNRQEWARIKSREQWEKYRDERIERLRRSLGEYPPAGKLNERRPGNGERGGVQDRERGIRAPARTVGTGQPVRAGPAAEVYAGNPARSCPSPRQAAGRIAGHGHDLGAGGLPRAGHRPGRLRRTPLAP